MAVLIAARSLRLRRAAARPAASTSIVERSSNRLLINELSRKISASMRSTDRDSSPRMNTPTPWRVSTTPSNLNFAIASRTTLRLTPNDSASSRSVGRRSPARIRPERISAEIIRATCEGRLGARPTVLIALFPACCARCIEADSAVMTSVAPRHPQFCRPGDRRGRSRASNRNSANLRSDPRATIRPVCMM